MTNISFEDLKEGLSYFEEAEIYLNLMRKHNLTQGELSDKICKSQPTIANKIRLLNLCPAVRRILIDNNLSERHARALTSLRNEKLQLKILESICKKKLTVRETEELVEKAKEKVNNPRWSFMNSIKESIVTAKESGFNVKAQQIDKGEYVQIVIHVPKIAR